jgi:hypothetical protein
MTTKQHHRGAHPDDELLFNNDIRETLLMAVTDAIWLLDRGYTIEPVLDIVGNRYGLHARQRLALQRSICTTTRKDVRLARCIPVDSLKNEIIEIDGFNLIIGIEIALSHGLLIRGCDGAYRDLAGLRGSYHTVDETDKALTLLGNVFRVLGCGRVHFYLDQPVSNSGRLRSTIIEHASHWSTQVNVEIVRNPDILLFDKKNVVSGDALVLDHVKSWVNLMEYLTKVIDNVWVLDLYNREIPDKGES